MARGGAIVCGHLAEGYVHPVGAVPRMLGAELAGAGIEALAAFGPEASRLREFAADLVQRGR